ncbi:MAG: indole-3-glycerol phosphate synthase TrpC [Cyclobacteriaceae bacterium]
MNILEEINAHKQQLVNERKSLFPVKLLEQSIHFDAPTVSLKEYIRREDKVGIIAEFKRQSPSKGLINGHASVEQTSIGYMQGGASGLSVLTDTKYFGGKNEDLLTARQFNYCPILRKDFIVDEYQLVEAKSIGADVILLIAASLTPDQVRSLAQFAKSLSLEVLLEVHNEDELDRSVCPEVDLLGVNNRDLTTFTTSIDTSKKLAEKIPNEFLKVSESGISDPEIVADLMNYGYEGFLIGENFMRTPNPGLSCGAFVKKLKELRA